MPYNVEDDTATVDTAQGRTTITLEIDTLIANILVDRTSRFLSWVVRQRRSSAALLLFERRHMGMNSIEGTIGRNSVRRL